MSKQSKNKIDTPEVDTKEFVGRAKELSEFSEMLELVRRENKTLVIQGNLGSGKSKFSASIIDFYDNSALQTIKSFTAGTKEEFLQALKESTTNKPLVIAFDTFERIDNKSSIFKLIEENKSEEQLPILSPQYLKNEVSPYLSAIGSIQNLINEVRRIRPEEIAIRNIQQHSPISVSLDGAAEAVQLAQEIVVPWKRKHAETMARLLESEKQLEIEKLKAEVLDKRASAAKGRVETQKLVLDTEKQKEDIERAKLENEKLRLELQREKIQLALDVLKQISVELSESQKIEYVVKLLEPLNILTNSKLAIVSGDKSS